MSDITELTAAEIQALFSACTFVVDVLRTEIGYPAVNIILNNGEVAGQSVEHLHFHVVPRSPGDIANAKRWLSDELFNKLYRPTSRQFATVSSRFRSALALRGTVAPTQIPRCLGKNISIGAKVFFGNNVTLYEGATIGDNSFIGDSVSLGYQDPRNKSTSISATIIGPGAVIRSGTVIYHGVCVGAEFNCAHNVVVRENTVIGDNCYLLPGAQVHAQVTIGSHVRIHGFVCNRAIIGDGCSSLGSLVHHYRSRRAGALEPSPVLERNVVVGVGAVVVGGVTIEKDAVIGAGSVITKNVPMGATVLGGMT